MHILIAPDSFKESLTAAEVAQAIADGLEYELPESVFDLVPIADGGEGTVDAIVNAVSGEFVTCEVTGPLGEMRRAKYGLIDDGNTAVVEMAEACGLQLVPKDQRDPLQTTSYGFGELTRDAIAKGAKHVVFGVGGSSTNDGGLGMCQALGAKFYSDDTTEMEHPIKGADLTAIKRLDLSELKANLRHIRFTAACDVNNPLLGPNGATYIFGPQKGATEASLKNLELGLGNAFDVIESESGKIVRHIPGAGAAGGTGAALLGLLNANLQPGVDLVAKLTQLATRVSNADIVITGEGCLDGQSALGKAPVGVAKIANAAGVPIIAIGGMLAEDASILYEHGIGAIESTVVRPCDGDDAMANARNNLILASQRVGRWLKLAESLRVQ